MAYGIEMVEWDAQAALPDGTHAPDHSPEKLQQLVRKFLEVRQRGGKLLVTLPLAEPGRAILVFEFVGDAPEGVTLHQL